LSRNGTHYETVKQSSKIIYDPTDLLRFNNQYNIDFSPEDDMVGDVVSAKIFFSNLVTKELQLQKLTLNGTFEERRICLKKILEVEQKLDLINQAITRGQEGKEAALMLISQAIPCIMHL
jgi:hypothetical protein